MDLNCAAIFVSVVEAGGISAAGRSLSMPKTTISKKLNDLETDLGVRLLNRTTRKISLTEAGERVYPHCLAALAQMQEASKAARALQESPTGLLTIAAPGALGEPFLMPLVAAFMRQHPLIDVAYTSLDSAVDLSKAQIDVMIWAGETAPPGHSVRLVTHVEIALYASQDYITRFGAPKTPHDLQKHPVAAFNQALAGGRFAWRLFRDGKPPETAPAGPIRFRSNDARAILAAVAAGCGVGGLPMRFVGDHSAKDQLVQVLPEWRASSVELTAFYRDGGAAALKTRLFLDFLADWYRNN